MSTPEDPPEVIAHPPAPEISDIDAIPVPQEILDWEAQNL